MGKKNNRNVDQSPVPQGVTKRAKKPVLHLVYGGTFNPIHHGHVNIIKALVQTFPEAVIHVMPNYTSPLKSYSTAPEHRLAMIEAALAEIEGFDRHVLPQKKPGVYLDRTEIDKPQPSVACDTVQTLSALYPGDKIAWIVGTDTMSSFHKWVRWESLLDYCHLYVVTRKGIDWEMADSVQAHVSARMQSLNEMEVGTRVLSLFEEKPLPPITLKTTRASSGGVFFDTTIAVDELSSTAIRACLESGDATDDYLSPSVRAIIDAEGLYGVVSRACQP
jgi:nicotinate-nucleotide adenylyltransferase